MTPGDAFTAAWLKRGEELRARRNAGDAMTLDEQKELELLEERAESMVRTPPETADNPDTLFVNEARSPNLDGSDYLEQLRKRECALFLTQAADFVSRYGLPALDAIVLVLKQR